MVIQKSYSRYRKFHLAWQETTTENQNSAQLPADRGGLALPNIYYYNWACHACSLLEWLHAHLNSKPCLDSWTSQSSSLWSLVTGDGKRLPRDIKNNPIIYNTVRVWRGIGKHMGEVPCTSLLNPLIRNQDFTPGLVPSIFDLWHSRGVKVVGDLYTENVLMTFQQLQSKFDIPKEHFYGFFQIRHFIGSRKFSPSGGVLYNEIEKFLVKKQKYHAFYLRFLCIALLP